MPRQVVRVIHIGFLRAGIASAIGCGVGVENDFPAAGHRQADAVAGARRRREVEYADDDFLRIAAFAQERNDGTCRIVEINPVESFP